MTHRAGYEPVGSGYLRSTTKTMPTGASDEAIDRADMVLAMARQNGERRLETCGLLARADSAHTRAGQRDQAIRDYTDALRLATEVGMHHLRCWALAGP